LLTIQLVDHTISKATIALKTLFRRTTKSTNYGTGALLEKGSSSDEHLTRTASSPGQSPDSVPTCYILKHKRSDAVIGLPAIMLIEEEPQSYASEPFPRYSYSFDVSRNMQDHKHIEYPHIVVTPASMDGDPGDRLEELSNL